MRSWCRCAFVRLAAMRQCNNSFGRVSRSRSFCVQMTPKFVLLHENRSWIGFSAIRASSPHASNSSSTLKHRLPRGQADPPCQYRAWLRTVKVGRLIQLRQLIGTSSLMGLTSRSRRAGQRPYFLTTREIEVLEWVARGKSAWEIGEILAITKRTVDEHVHSAFARSAQPTELMPSPCDSRSHHQHVTKRHCHK